MKNALILHGTANNHTGNWFMWLKKELENKGYKVWVPDLPNSEQANVKRYNKFIFSNKDFSFNKETLIIGHSSGAVAILGLLQKLPQDVKINKAILVASFMNDFGDPDFSGLFEEPFDFGKIKTKSKKIIFVHSDDDPYCPLSHAEYLSEKLNAELVVIKG
jgi:predicted alpha/beta hydrolase family esterase